MSEPEIALVRYVVALLETIACNNRSAISTETGEYLERIQNACGCKEGTEAIFRGLAPVQALEVRPGQKQKGK